MKLINGSSKGFFAVCSDTARQISHCLKRNEEWFVSWGKETQFYYDESYGNNIWNYYAQKIYSN